MCGIEVRDGESVPSNLGRRLGTIVRLAEPGSSWLRCHAGAEPRKRKEKRYQRHTHVDVVTKSCYKAYLSPKAMWKWAGSFAKRK